MAITEKPKTGTALAKEAAQDPAISDYRKSTKSFGVIARGVGASDTEPVCSAVMLDLVSGKLDIAQAAVLFQGVSLMLKREDQNIAREDMSHRAEMLIKRGRKQAARRELRD